MEPRKQKKLGQQVTGFRDDLWMANRCDIVFRGNMAKFTQNPSLREVLLQTGDRQLVEASPLDEIWGIGLAANDPQAYDPCQWLGENLLGMVLERVRDHLRSSV
ncbi:MAG: NADAR family protein, partial [Pirellulaceae bacterium]